jgi:hypothetical protein
LWATRPVQARWAGAAVWKERGNAYGRAAFQALATMAFDDPTCTYRFRAYNDGRYLDTEITVGTGAFALGFAADP